MNNIVSIICYVQLCCCGCLSAVITSTYAWYVHDCNFASLLSLPLVVDILMLATVIVLKSSVLLMPISTEPSFSDTV